MLDEKGSGGMMHGWVAHKLVKVFFYKFFQCLKGLSWRLILVK